MADDRQPIGIPPVGDRPCFPLRSRVMRFSGHLPKRRRPVRWVVAFAIALGSAALAGPAQAGPIYGFSVIPDAGSSATNAADGEGQLTFEVNDLASTVQFIFRNV